MRKQEIINKLQQVVRTHNGKPLDQKAALKPSALVGKVIVARFLSMTDEQRKAIKGISTPQTADALKVLLPELGKLIDQKMGNGSATPRFASGGAAGETYHEKGLLNSAGPGRTDTINTNVPTGAYVIPADVVSGLGEGNTLAGSAVIDRMFGTSPYGIKAPQIRHGRGAPEGRAPEAINPDAGPSTVDTGFINSAGAYANGGRADDGKAPVVVAGGEHVLSPQQIIGKFGSLKKGHKILDHWVVLQRGKHIKELKGLAPPVGSNVRK